MRGAELPRLLVAMPTLIALVLTAASYRELGALSVRYAEVHAGPPGEQWCGRVRLLEEKGGALTGVVAAPIQLVVAQGGATAVNSLTTGPGGWTDFCVRLHPLGATPVVTLRAPGSGDLLAAGRLEPSLDRWRRLAARQGVPSFGSPSVGVLTTRFEPPVWSAPFGGVFWVESDAQEPVAFVATLSGAILRSPASSPAPARAPARLALGLLQHVAAVGLAWQDGARRMTRVVPIPVRPGSLTFERSRDAFLIRSPVLRERAYWCVVGPWGRDRGGAITLHAEPNGTAVGSLPASELPLRPDRYLFLSSAPDGLSPASIGLPLDGQRGTFDVGEMRLFSGQQMAYQKADVERRRFGWALAAVVSAAGILTLAILVAELRSADRRLGRELAQVGAPRAMRDTALALPTLALLSLFFAFYLAVVWIVAR